MFVFKVNLLFFVFCDFPINSRGLERLVLPDDGIILVTEAIIRNTTNNLFSGLNLKVRKLNKKLRQASLVHNFLTSVTLKDHKSLNDIVRLTRVDKNTANNETQLIIKILNEILNEDWNESYDSDIVAENEDIVQYVDEFLINLEVFKENSGISNNYDSLDIKDEIIHILQSGDPSLYKESNSNVTVTPTLDENDNVLSENEFWVPDEETRRIYRGERVKIKYFPFMASIHVFNSFQCGGSIIKSDLIITAASCLQLAWNNRLFRENPAFLSIRVGTKFYNGGGESIPILEVYFHPEYSPRNLRNNIALLRLRRHLKFRRTKKRLKKIDFDRNDSPLPMNTDGITIIGWGAKLAGNVVRDPWSNQLAFAVLDVYHLGECQDIYSKEYVTRTNFCAGFISKGGGACNHDVGDPGVVNGILTGIASFGSPVCGTPDAPTVFTKVGFYADWIEEIMEQHVYVGKVRTTLEPPTLPPYLTRPPGYPQRTTFKITPIKDKPRMDPIPISKIDSMRILQDEQLFKDFVETMFGSKEAQEYKELLEDESKTDTNDNELGPPESNRPAKYEENRDLIDLTRIRPAKPISKPEKEEHKPKKHHDKNYENGVTSVIENTFGTKLDPFETVTEQQKMYTGIDKNLLIDDDVIEEHIIQFIDNIDDGKADKESIESGSEEFAKNKAKHVRKDSDVVTLLYLSDDEKSSVSIEDIAKVIEDSDDNVEGLSISVDGFKDMTFRSNKTESVLNLFSKDELYNLLSETIDRLVSNKTLNLS